MDKIQKLEAAWLWARSARRAALRQKREEHGDPRNPLQALPGHEAKFKAAAELSQSMDVILEVLEREIARARLEGVKRTAARFRDLAAEFLFWFGLTCLAALGPAAACVMARAPDPIIRAASLAGIALSLALAAKTARK